MNTTATTTDLLTYDEFVRRHGDEKLVDLVNGRVERYPMPHAEHGYVINNVAVLIGSIPAWGAEPGVVLGRSLQKRCSRQEVEVRDARRDRLFQAVDEVVDTERTSRAERCRHRAIVQEIGEIAAGILNGVMEQATPRAALSTVAAQRR